MHMWGMVTDEVVHLGGLIDGGSDRLTDIGTSVLGQACREDIWRGVDADRFRNAAREVRDLLNDVAEQLEQQARVLEEHVMEQDVGGRHGSHRRSAGSHGRWRRARSGAATREPW